MTKHANLAAGSVLGRYELVLHVAANAVLRAEIRRYVDSVMCLERIRDMPKAAGQYRRGITDDPNTLAVQKCRFFSEKSFNAETSSRHKTKREKRERY